MPKFWEINLIFKFKMTIKKTAIEVERAFWARTAKQGHWFEEPFFVQIWIDKDGKIQDSVSFKDLKSDKFLEWESNKIISPEIIEEIID